jgi:hypothetical protein
MFARSEVEVVIQQGTKCGIFVNQSTATHMTLYPLNSGSPVTKFIDILMHGFDGMQEALRIPVGYYQEVWLS